MFYEIRKIMSIIVIIRLNPMITAQALYDLEEEPELDLPTDAAPYDWLLLPPEVILMALPVEEPDDVLPLVAELPNELKPDFEPELEPKLEPNEEPKPEPELEPMLDDPVLPPKLLPPKEPPKPPLEMPVLPKPAPAKPALATG